MDETTWNTFEFCLRGWTENSLLFKDTERWLEGLKQELAETPRLEEEIRTLSLEIDLRLQSLLLDADFNADEVFELMRLASTAIDIVDADGGVIKWRQERRNYQH